ncbi:Monocarboxylate 2-oxoacid-binding periplasmic protein [subsurface metagenome]
MKSKKILVLLGTIALAIVLTMAFVPGCAKEAPVPAPAPAPAPAPVPAPAPSPTPAPAEEVIKWRLASYMPEANPWFKSIVRATKNVETMSNGRFVIECFPGGAVAPATKEFDALDRGIVEMAQTSMHYNMDKFSCGGLFGIIVAGPTPIVYLAWYLQGGGQDLINEMFTDYNVLSIGVQIIGRAEMFGYSNTPLETMADFKGLKFRTAGDWGEVITEYFGASVIFCPGGEVYEAMQRGVIDAFEFSSPSVNVPFGFNEIAKYAMFPGIHAPGVLIPSLVNKDAWNALPDDLKLILKEAIQSECLRNHIIESHQDMWGVEQHKEMGMEIVYLPEDVQREIEAAARDFYSKKADEDPFFKEVWTSVSEYQKALGETNKLQFPYYR